VEDCHEWVPMLDDGGGGAPDDDGVEDKDHWLGGGGPLLINDEGNQVGGATGVNSNSMRCTTATAFASTSSKTMASEQWGVLSVVAFIVNSNCIVT
jgi:hypothetical protein